MARIPYFDPAQAVGRTAAAYERLPPLNISRMMGHAGALMDGFAKFGGQILNFMSLDPGLREIAILRVGHLLGAPYEVFQHERIAGEVGLAAAVIAAIREGPDASAFDEAQREVMAFTDALVANVRAGDAAFGAILARHGARGAQELTLTIGYYMMVCRFLETFEVDIETGPPPRVLGAPRDKLSLG